jgi:hypothetical protein
MVSMNTTNHSRLFMILCLGVIISLLYSGCAAPPTGQPASPQQPEATQQPAPTQPPARPEPCVVNNDRSLVCTFPQENESGDVVGQVTLELPWQKQERTLTIEKRDFGGDMSLQFAPNDYGFKLLRPVINIEVIDSNDGSVVQDFDPPLNMTATFNTDDWEKAGITPEQLFIAIYNPDSGQFQPFDSRENPDLDTFIDTSASTGTIRVAHLTSQAYWASPDTMIHDFLQEDGQGSVTLELPWQGRELEFNRKSFDEDLAQPISPDQYLSRIIYVQVIDPSDGSVVHDFNPPLTMTAEYGDLEDQGYSSKELFIGIYDHEKQIFNDYTPEFDPSSRTGTISIESWTSHVCWRK